MKGNSLLGLVKETFQDWTQDKASRLGAALAYYAIFSIGPMLVVVIAIAGKVFGKDAAEGKISDTLSQVLSSDAAKFVEALVTSASKPKEGTIATVVGTGTLLLSAMGVFGQLKDALNTIWEVEPVPGGGIMAALTKNFLSFGMLLGVGFLLLVSLVVNALLSTLGPFLRDALPGGALLWNAVNYVITLAIISLMFALIFKFVPDIRVGWKEVLLGGVVTATLFLLGQIALGIYLSLGNVGSAFGAAASLVIVLVWIYYSAQILFLGAEFTQVYANRYGSGMAPGRHARLLTEEARAQQGTKSKQPRKQAAREQEAEPGSPTHKTSPWFRYVSHVETELPRRQARAKDHGKRMKGLGCRGTMHQAPTAICLCRTRGTVFPLVILSVAKDQPPVLDPLYCCTAVPHATSSQKVEDSGLPT
ncbi:MAG TPA: YihY/virulence factor BrkB family protein [Chloroflexia bacterium]|nr:YihY/virulence factor BrkB family protein [Chloroflexia bacterium]